MAQKLAGIAYPFQTYGKGTPREASGTDVYAAAFYSLLRTNQRSRVMRPGLGTRVQHLIFETTGPFLKTRIAQEILQATANEIPNVNINFIGVEEKDTLVTVSIMYSINGIQYEDQISLNRG